MSFLTYAALLSLTLIVCFLFVHSLLGDINQVILSKQIKPRVIMAMAIDIVGVIYTVHMLLKF